MNRFGWLGPEAAQEAWDQLASHFVPLVVTGGPTATLGERAVLWDAAKALTGGFLPNIPQQIGDCVAWGLKHAIDHLATVEIVRLGDRERFRPCFAPYFYATSRVQVGGGRIAGDGSLGSWGAEAVRRHGTLAADQPGVPPYSGAIARAWGRSGPPASFREIARPHIVQSVARLRSYEQVREALANYYPITIASLRGFAMSLAFDARTNKHWWQGRATWPHQMCLLGVDDNPRRPGVYRGNSWGPAAHGPQADGPPGGGWQDAEDLDRELRHPGTECFAYSQFVGFPMQTLDFSAF